jgi:hypothetical protein
MGTTQPWISEGRIMFLMEDAVHNKDLFGNLHRLNDGKLFDERQTLIDFFSREMQRPSLRMRLRLSHCELGDLYALQSAFRNRSRTNGKTTAIRYFWWTTRTVAI